MHAFQKIGVVGFGNVGSHIVSRLVDLEFNNIKVWCSLKHELPKSVQHIQNASEFNGCDLVICAIPDNEMLNVLIQVAKFAPAVSVSGTVSIENISTKFPIGTLYPLLSFVQKKKVNWKQLPIFTNAENKNFLEEITQFANLLSGNGIILTEEKRLELHIAAVFANNFTTHLLDTAAHLCEENKLNFEWLKPLISQNFHAIMDNHPHLLQTGPAKRNDHSTIANHLSQLEGIRKEIYTLLTTSIMAHYQKQ